MLKIFTLLLAALLTSCTTQSNFSHTTVDVGIVVSDIDKSLDFYQKIGFKPIAKFTADSEVAGKSGLLNFKSIEIHVLSLDGDKNGTKVKLMQAASKANSQDQKYIDSTYGISYLTVFVKDSKKILKNLKAHSITPYAEGPASLDKVGLKGQFLTCLKDPDGNFIELVGP